MGIVAVSGLSVELREADGVEGIRADVWIVIRVDPSRAARVALDGVVDRAARVATAHPMRAITFASGFNGLDTH
jgi:hypothetical protein